MSLLFLKGLHNRTDRRQEVPSFQSGSGDLHPQALQRHPGLHVSVKFCPLCASMCFVFMCNTLCADIFRKLTKVLKNYVDNAEKLTEQLLKALKALEYIFKFIVRSRVLFNQYVQIAHVRFYSLHIWALGIYHPNPWSSACSLNQGIIINNNNNNNNNNSYYY